MWEPDAGLGYFTSAGLVDEYQSRRTAASPCRPISPACPRRATKFLRHRACPPPMRSRRWCSRSNPRPHPRAVPADHGHRGRSAAVPAYRPHRCQRFERRRNPVRSRPRPIPGVDFPGSRGAVDPAAPCPDPRGVDPGSDACAAPASEPAMVPLTAEQAAALAAMAVEAPVPVTPAAPESANTTAEPALQWITSLPAGVSMMGEPVVVSR